MEAKPEARSNKRKFLAGIVVSDKMTKTRVVQVLGSSKHPKYQKTVRSAVKFKAHDESNDARIGDTVLIEESRPLSATKRWRLISVVQRGGDHALAGEIVAEEAETMEAIHAAAHPGRSRVEDEDRAAPDGEVEA